MFKDKFLNYLKNILTDKKHKIPYVYFTKYLFHTILGNLLFQEIIK